jgi:hypothetical protein
MNRSLMFSLFLLVIVSFLFLVDANTECEDNHYCSYWVSEDGHVELFSKEKNFDDQQYFDLDSIREKDEGINKQDDDFKTMWWKDCGSVPTASCFVTKDTVFEPGVYYLSDGIYLSSSSNVVLDCNGATLIGTGNYNGALVRYGSNSTIKNCNFINYNIGINVHDAFNISLLNNNVINSGNYGISISNSPFSRVEENNVETSSLSGIYIVISKNVSVIRNNVIDILWSGIAIREADNNTIEGNYISRSGTRGGGIMLVGNGNSFTNNVLINNSYGLTIMPNSDNNIIKGNRVYSSNISGIFFRNTNYEGKEGEFAKNNILSENFACGSVLDFRAAGADKKNNLGYNNSCGKPGSLIWMWNDVGTFGCSYSCSENICDKLEPASAKKGFKLISSNSDTWMVGFRNWVTNSSRSEFGNCNSNMSFASSVEYELDVPMNRNNLRIAYSYLFYNVDNMNSIMFSTEVYVFNFEKKNWERVNIHHNPSESGIDDQNVHVDVSLFPERISDGKIRLRVVQRNIDTDIKRCIWGGSWVYGQSWIGSFYLNRFTHQFCISNYNTVSIFPSVNYRTSDEHLKIAVYAYDNNRGREVSLGSGEYRIYNETMSVFGDLAYEGGLWKRDFKYKLADGRYNVEININGFSRNVFLDVRRRSPGRVYGEIRNDKGELMSDATVEIYKFNQYPELVLTSFSASKNYSVDIEPGVYIMRAKKNNMESTTLSFLILPDDNIKRNFIISDKENLKPAVLELREKFLDKMDSDAERMAELTKLARKDLGVSEVGFIKEVSLFKIEAIKTIKTGTLPSIGGILTELIAAGVKSIAHQHNYKKQLEELSYATAASIAEIDNNNDITNAFEWLADNDGKRIKERTFGEIIGLNVYKKSIFAIDDNYNSFKMSHHDDFDYSKARKVVGDQMTQIDGMFSSDIYLLPDAKDDYIIWTFIHHYDNYIDHHNGIKTMKTGKWCITGVSVAAGVVSGVFAGAAASPTIVGAVPAGIGAGVATFFKVQAVLKPISLSFTAAEVLISFAASQSFVFAASEWAIDTARTPDIYNKTLQFINAESKNPYYLNKNNKFDSEVSIDIKPDAVINGQNVVYPQFSLLSWGGYLRNSSIRVRNSFDPAQTRVLSQTGHTYRESWWNSRRSMQLTGYNYKSFDMGRNEFRTINLAYEGEEFFTLNPRVFVIQVFSGPFQTSINNEYYFVVPRSLTKKESVSSSWNEIKTTELPMREKDKMLTSEDYISYTSKITHIKNDNNEFGIMSASEKNHEISLNRNSSKFEFNFTVGDYYGAEFHLFYPIGTDVDLYVYDDDSYIGFNSERGDSEIGLPGFYSGKYSSPEIIYVPRATGKTYRVVAKLAKENSDLSVPIKISVLEEPFRPEIISVYPPRMESIHSSEDANISLDFFISEIGAQKPIHNISAEIELPLVNLTENKLYFDSIGAGSIGALNYNFEAKKAGRYTGKLKVNSSAGYMEVDIKILVDIDDIVLTGDVNGDCKVDIFDLAIVGKAYGTFHGQNGYDHNADLNSDGKIDIFDLAIVGKNYGDEC